MAETFAPISDEEKARIRQHLGYPNTQAVANILLGIPALTQTAFIAEGQMGRVIDTSVQILRTLLGRCDALEQRIFEVGLGQLDAEKVDEITINLNAPNDLEREYIRWVDRMADFLGCVKNPYSPRWMGTGRQPISVPIQH